MIPGDLLSAFPHRQFHTLPGLLDSWAALPNSNPNACMPMQGGSLYHFYDGLWYDPAGRRTHDLPCERRTRYRLSQPDTVDDLEPNLFMYCVWPNLGITQRPPIPETHAVHVLATMMTSMQMPKIMMACGEINLLSKHNV